MDSQRTASARQLAEHLWDPAKLATQYESVYRQAIGITVAHDCALGSMVIDRETST